MLPPPLSAAQFVIRDLCNRNRPSRSLSLSLSLSKVGWLATLALSNETGLDIMAGSKQAKFPNGLAGGVTEG